MKRKNIKIAGMIVAASLMAVSVCGCADKGEEASATDYSNEEIIDNNEDKTDAKSYVFLNSDGSVEKVYLNSEEISDNLNDTNNPIGINISYELDGKKTEPDALAGVKRTFKGFVFVYK